MTDAAKANFYAPRFDVRVEIMQTLDFSRLGRPTGNAFIESSSARMCSQPMISIVSCASMSCLEETRRCAIASTGFMLQSIRCR